MPEPMTQDEDDPRFFAYDDDAVCEHDCDEMCELEGGCRHEHCFNCGGCGCPGYCDDYQTYNLRPAGDGLVVSEEQSQC